MYTKLNIYSDGFLSYAAAFIISYAVFIYNRLGVLKSLTLSLIVGFFAAATVFIIKNFMGIKHGEKAQRKALIETLSVSFAFYNEDKLLTLFKTLLEKQNLTVVKHRRFLEITELNAAFCPIFKNGKLDPEDLINAYKRCGFKKTFIAAKSYEEDSYKLSALKPETFTLFDEEDVFIALEKFNLLPEIKLPEIKKRTIKSFAVSLFKKENFKKFFFFFLIIISLSTVSSIPVFFIIAGSIISLISVAIKLAAPETPRKDKGIFIPATKGGKKEENSATS